MFIEHDRLGGLVVFGSANDDDAGFRGKQSSGRLQDASTGRARLVTAGRWKSRGLEK